MYFSRVNNIGIDPMFLALGKPYSQIFNMLIPDYKEIIFVFG